MKLKQVPAILPFTLEKMVKPWLTGIHKADITAVMSYPASDRQRRFLNLQSNPQFMEKHLPDYKSYIWITIDFRVDPIDDVVDLEATIVRKLKEQTRIRLPKTIDFPKKLQKVEKNYGKKVILVAFGCEQLLRSNKTPLLIWTTVMSRSDMLRLLLFFECNLFSIEAVDIFSRVPAFQPRIQIISLYDDKNVRQFISHMSLKWQMKVPEKIQEDIIRQCGGMLLLVKEALWYLRDHPKGEALQIFNHPEMRFNLASLWQGFGEDERMVLQSLTKGDAFDKLKFKSNIDYLRLVGILENHGHTYRITIPLLSNYIKESFLTAKQLTTDDGGKIYLDGIVVSTHFSRKERRVLSFLIKQVNTLVTREQLSNELWPTDLEKNYSDWAIDSHISRLRKRLVNLGLDRGILKTRKGRGFILRRNGEYD